MTKKPTFDPRKLMEKAVTSKEYMTALDLKYRTAMNHINRFEELSLLTSKGEGRARRYLVQKP